MPQGRLLCAYLSISSEFPDNGAWENSQMFIEVELFRHSYCIYHLYL